MYLGAPNYKRTTDKQYNLLKHKMAILAQQIENYNKNNTGTYKQETAYWKDLTEKLNSLGPPYRTLQQWKKVWSDFRRADNKRKSKSKTKHKQNIKKDAKYDKSRDLGEEDEEEEASQSQYELHTSREVNSNIKRESEEYEHDNQTMKPTFSNEYDNEYSYPDEQSLQESYADEKEILLPDESSCGSYTYAPPELKPRTQQTSVNHQASGINYATPPPLQPSNARLMDQTLYTLQNQMDHQTKLLEHMSQMSGTMTDLMERQVKAVEKQTEAIRRQAAATEHHTLVLNSFMDMIRDKMQKGNSMKTTASTRNFVNNIL
ncbi:uncharacterized protein LOC135951558 isoform X1 [Calliphora vicina]|uniref:uncharacterized protein LOC135951558 isoform X1 n=1 Tax=Calliphora vicina TaxID=7373 RepID=UPI00325BBA50